MQAQKIRRGRPRHNRPFMDKGTCELQRKRMQLLNKGETQDFTLAESLLGVFYAHDLISKPLYQTGCFFGELGYKYASCLGYSFRARSSVLVLNRRGTPTISDSDDEKKIKAWRRALEALKQAGKHPYQIVLKVVFYEEDLYVYGVPKLLLKESPSLCQGLECLEAYFKGALKDKRDTFLDPGSNHVRATTPQPLSKERQFFHPS